MFATRSELLDKIQLGEDSYLELKEVRVSGGKVQGPTQNDLADEIAAFANSHGGVLLLGVQDNPREVIGIPVKLLDDVEALVRQACEDSINTSVAPVIERLRLPDSTSAEQAVMRVDVPRSLFVHSSPSGYLHRVGSSKRRIAPDQLARLFQHRSQSRMIRFDESPIPTATLADLDQALWGKFTTHRLTAEPEQLLSKLAMASQDDAGVWRPTVAGTLLACTKPEQFLPSAFIQAVAYQGKQISPETEPPYQRDARDIGGPLDQQISGACAFVRKNMSSAAKKGATGGREDIPQFNMLAVFEAMTNAVAHRDYSMAGSKVRLRIFDDRLELYTPGSLVNTMTPESLPHRQASRNEAIANLLARCPVGSDELGSHRTHIMDRRGQGVSTILSRSEDLSGRTPDYRLIDDAELLLTIYAAATDER